MIAVKDRSQGEVRMHRYAQDAGSKNYLVDDEVIEIRFEKHLFRYRLRIWRNKIRPAIVLASQLPGGVPPSWSRSTLANLAYQVYLAFPEKGMLYFESESEPEGPRLLQITFNLLGHDVRRRLVEPVQRSRRWCDFCSIVGSEVPR
jgi:hypothetical protein